jgi:hypothetical protein
MLADDIASVSTETEDDPVNMAMRATLGGSSTEEEEEEEESEDEEEEVILWGNKSGSVASAKDEPSAHLLACTEDIRPDTSTVLLNHHHQNLRLQHSTSFRTSCLMLSLLLKRILRLLRLQVPLPVAHPHSKTQSRLGSRRPDYSLVEIRLAGISGL